MERVRGIDVTGFKKGMLDGEFKYQETHTTKSDYETVAEQYKTTYLVFNILFQNGILKINYERGPSWETEKGERTAQFIRHDSHLNVAYIQLNEPINLKDNVEYKKRSGLFPVSEFELWLNHDSIGYKVADPTDKKKRNKE